MAAIKSWLELTKDEREDLTSWLEDTGNKTAALGAAALRELERLPEIAKALLRGCHRCGAGKEIRVQRELNDLLLVGVKVRPLTREPPFAPTCSFCGDSRYWVAPDDTTRPCPECNSGKGRKNGT